MKMRIAAVGRIKESYVKSGVEEYLTRLRPVQPIEVIEVASVEALPREGHTIALSEWGERFTSEAFARRLSELEREERLITFWIGPAEGLPKETLNAANWQLSLSTMTFPHDVARFLLVEQLYRATRIRRGEPYHK